MLGGSAANSQYHDRAERVYQLPGMRCARLHVEVLSTSRPTPAASSRTVVQALRRDRAVCILAVPVLLCLGVEGHLRGAEALRDDGAVAREGAVLVHLPQESRRRIGAVANPRSGS